MATTSGNQITLSATDINFTLSGSTAFDITGNNFNNYITGNSAANNIYGGYGNDSLVGNLGHDSLYGGEDNDSLLGGEGNDSLYGGEGNDTLDGSAGIDVMQGNNGNDAYVVDNITDVVIEAIDEGTQDIVYSYANNYVLTDNVEMLTLLGTTDLNGTGNDLNNRISGNSGINRLYGGQGNDSLIGAAGNDTLYGGDGNDTLDGGVGTDKLQGDYGSDSYVVDNASDSIVENLNQGTDIVYSYIDYTLGSNLEYLVLMGSSNLNGTGNELNNRLTGNAGDNLLIGGAGNDTLYGGLGYDTLLGGDGNDSLLGQGQDNELRGGAGNDVYMLNSDAVDSVFEEANQGNDTITIQGSYTLGDNFENLNFTGSSHAIGRGNALNNTLTGNDGDNQLFGEAGNDFLDGRVGANTLTGGTGNDIYVVNSATDFIIEANNEGIDTVNLKYSPIKWDQRGYYVADDYILADSLENLNILYTGLQGTGRGNYKDNLIITDNWVSAYGEGGNDTLRGKNSLALYGGAGNDTIFCDGAPTYVYQTGGQRAPSLNGEDGNDSIKYISKIGLASGLMIGSMISGGAGDDTIDVTEAQNSWAQGNMGNDTYIVGQSSTGTLLIEQVNEGIDTVKSSISFSLSNAETLDVQHVSKPSPNTAESEPETFEYLTLTGSANINGYGNNLNNYVFGNSGNNLLEGRDGHDYIISYGGNDTLVGGNGNDTLMASSNLSAGATLSLSGTIEMTGDAGNDTFWMVRGYVGNHATGANQLSVTDFTHGVDRVLFTINTGTTAPTALNTLTAGSGDTLTSLLNQAAAASASTSAPTVSAFVFSGNTYLVLDQSSDATFANASDLAIKLVGTPTLTFSDLAFLAMA